MKASVVIPVLDEVHRIGRAVRSVLAAAGRRDVEVLVVDDGSTDGTQDVVRALGAGDARVRLLQRPADARHGPAAARNAGLAAAAGELVAFLDADDTVEPARFDVAWPLLEQDAALDGVLVPVRVHFEAEADASAHDHLPEVLDHAPDIEPGGFAEATLFGRSRFHISNLLVRRRLVERVGPFDERRRLGEEDTDFWLRLALAGTFRGVSHGVPQVTYTRHATNRWSPSLAWLFRDLDVVMRVERWARKQPDLEAARLVAFRRALRYKVQFCLDTARRSGSLRQAARVVRIVAPRAPGLLVARTPLSLLARTVVAALTGRHEGPAVPAGGEGVPDARA